MNLNDIYESFVIDKYSNSNDRYINDADPSNCIYDFTIDSKYYSVDEYNDYITTTNTSNYNLHILQLNARSLKNKLDSFNIFVESFKNDFDIISICET